MVIFVGIHTALILDDSLTAGFYAGIDTCAAACQNGSAESSAFVGCHGLDGNVINICQHLLPEGTLAAPENIAFTTQLGGDLVQTGIGFGQCVSLGSDVTVVEAEVVNVQLLHQFESCVCLVPGDLHGISGTVVFDEVIYTEQHYFTAILYRIYLDKDCQKLYK